MEYKIKSAKSGIHINPKNKGKFNALKKRTGKSTEELTHSKNPLTRKRAIFAQNAKKWKHETGGEVQYKDGIRNKRISPKISNAKEGKKLIPKNQKGKTMPYPKELQKVNVPITKDVGTIKQYDNSIWGNINRSAYKIQDYLPESAKVILPGASDFEDAIQLKEAFGPTGTISDKLIGLAGVALPVAGTKTLKAGQKWIKELTDDGPIIKIGDKIVYSGDDAKTFSDLVERGTGFTPLHPDQVLDAIRQQGHLRARRGSIDTPVYVTHKNSPSKYYLEHTDISDILPGQHIRVGNTGSTMPMFGTRNVLPRTTFNIFDPNSSAKLVRFDNGKKLYITKDNYLDNLGYKEQVALFNSGY